MSLRASNVPHALLLALAILVAPVATAVAAPVSAVVNTGHVEASLVAETVSAPPGAVTYVALHQKIAPGWHTYWRNPGDAGQAVTLTWTLPSGWRAGDIVWPAPRRVLAGPLMSYVYTGTIDLPVPLNVPVSARTGGAASLRVKVDLLVCKDVCIPESATLALALPVSDAAPAMNPDGGTAIAATLAAAPKPSGLDARFQAAGDTVKLAATGGSLAANPVTADEAAHAYFFPFDGTALEQAKPQRVERGAKGVTLDLPAGYAFTSGKPIATLAGVLALGDRAYELAATPGPAPADATGLAPTVESTIPAEATPLVQAVPKPAFGLLTALGLAFVGGLILNLMPCVFPILSMKAAALARHLDTPQHARREGLGFLAGVVVSLMTLAIVLVAARAAGQAIGWGFQMQSPPFVAVLVLVVFLAGLNLSGVFEVGSSLQNLGAETASRRSGLAGSVLTGVLAVVVAAPCTAPIMAAALGWALTQPPAAALAVFLALALGLAAPFTALSFAPGVFGRLPRPGAWMETLRRLLAFPMYATAAWLAWVFAEQAGVGALPILFAAVLAAAFAAWCWGLAQGGGRTVWPRAAAVLALAGAVGCVTLVGASAAPDAPASPPDTGQASTAPSRGGARTVLDVAQPWSPERVAALRAQGHPVFVDFTAAWCLTCQVNERTTLSSAAVKRAFDDTGAVYLRADWTRRDPRILKALNDDGRSGVPLYVVYGRPGAAPVLLPQILTSGAVSAALAAARS